MNKGKSLLENHMKDGHTCADDLQQNKGTCRIITLNSEDILRTSDMHLRLKNVTKLNKGRLAAVITHNWFGKTN